MEYMGYTVERQDESESILGAGGASLAYILTGKRGATYGLMRYPRRPSLMFVVRARTGVVCALKGNYTFTDEGGTLRARS